MTKLRLTKDDMVVDYELSINKPEGILLQVGEEYLKLTENIYESNEGTKLKITKEGIDYYPLITPIEDTKLIYKMSGNTGKLLVTPLNKTITKEYSYEIDWGDGSEKETIHSISSSNVTKSHTYTDGLEEHIITVTTLNPDYEDFWYPISFKDNTNLIEVLNFSGEYLGVDDQNGIGYALFYGCTNLTKLSSNFTLPQSLTRIGDNFCDSMLFKCTSLTHLPDNFNLPQGLIYAKNGFCQNMFYLCTSLTHLPDNFNLPQGSIAVYGSNFCQSMFNSCTSLTHLPDNFNLSQNVTPNISSGGLLRYCMNMFYNCSSLQTLQEGFTLPSYIGTECFSYSGRDMFSGTLIPIGTNDFPDCCW